MTNQKSELLGLIPKESMAEPFFSIPRQAISEWNETETVSRNQILRQTQKALFYRNAFDYIASQKIVGEYLEFGCHKARTFRMALLESHLQGLNKMRFFAFDSFEGLPQNDGSAHQGWKEGQLSTSEKTFLQLLSDSAFDIGNVSTVKGFYDQSLNSALITKLQKEGVKAAFACVDCDLYESAVPVFQFLESFLTEGTVLYLDDYFSGYRGNPQLGVPKAFSEFQEKSIWKFEPFLSVGWWGRSFIAYK